MTRFFFVSDIPPLQCLLHWGGEPEDHLKLSQARVKEEMWDWAQVYAKVSYYVEGPAPPDVG